MTTQDESRRSFREKAVAFFTKHLGPPEQLRAEPGYIYRWRIHREGPQRVNIYVTLDSPEYTDVAHIMISDPCAEGDRRIESHMMHSEDDFPAILEKIRDHFEC